MLALYILVPVVLLAFSVFYSIRSFKQGGNARRAVARHLCAFMLIGILSVAVPLMGNALTTDDIDPATTTSTEGASTSASDQMGIGMIAAALVMGLSGIGGGIAVAAAAPAAIGATSEDPKNFGKSLIFVALGEGIALYGLLISILIYSKF